MTLHHFFHLKGSPLHNQVLWFPDGKMIPRVIIKFGKKNDGKEASEKILRSFPLKKRKNNLPTKKERNDHLFNDTIEAMVPSSFLEGREKELPSPFQILVNNKDFTRFYWQAKFFTQWPKSMEVSMWEVQSYLFALMENMLPWKDFPCSY